VKWSLVLKDETYRYRVITGQLRDGRLSPEPSVFH
jgi:hypothetical protein